MSEQEYREFWIRQVESTITKEVYWQVHGSGVWLENKEAVSRFTHVIEYAAFQAAQDKIQQLEKQNQIMSDALERISQETILLGTELSTGAILARQALKDAEEV